MTTDYLSEIFRNAYTDTISEWQKQGFTDDEIIKKLNQDTINNSMKLLLDQASKDYHDYFVEKRFEISHKQKIEQDKFIAHHNDIWGECFAVSETMYVMALEAAERYSAFVNDNIPDDIKKEKQYTFLALQYMQGRSCQEF